MTTITFIDGKQEEERVIGVERLSGIFVSSDETRLPRKLGNSAAVDIAAAAAPGGQGMMAGQRAAIDCGAASLCVLLLRRQRC